MARNVILSSALLESLAGEAATAEIFASLNATNVGLRIYPFQTSKKIRIWGDWCFFIWNAIFRKGVAQSKNASKSKKLRIIK